MILCSCTIQLLFCTKSGQTLQLKFPEQDSGRGWIMCVQVAVEKVGNQGSDAILAEPVSSKILLQAVGTVD